MAGISFEARMTELTLTVHGVSSVRRRDDIAVQTVTFLYIHDRTNAHDSPLFAVGPRHVS